MLQCVAVGYSMLQSECACCSVLRCISAWFSVLQCVAACAVCVCVAASDCQSFLLQQKDSILKYSNPNFVKPHTNYSKYSYCVYIHACKHLHTHANMYAYIHTYTHTYIHTYVHTQSKLKHIQQTPQLEFHKGKLTQVIHSFEHA